MSVIAVCSGKGSPGTTFAAINLAAAMARASEEVLLLDLDPAGGDVAAYLGLDTRRGIYPLLRMDNGIPERAALLAEAEDRGGMHVVCGFPEASALSVSVDLLGHTVKNAGEARTVVCDLGRVTAGGARVAARADLVLLVVRPDLVSVLGAERALRLLESEGVARDRVSVLVSGAERRRPADLTEVGNALGLDVLASTPIHRRSARKALLSQMPIGKGPLARAFDGLATGINARISCVDEPKEVAVA